MVLILAVQTAFPAFAQSGDIDSVFGYFAPEGGFYDELEYGENDWAAYCRIRLYGTVGAEEYLERVRASAEELMASDGFVKPTELQRAAIILSAAGMCSEELINAAVYNNDKLDRQGFNAYIWALIAANCCDIPQPENTLNTKASFAEYIISKQLTDGGFALNGSAADTDITAAAIYALSPLREDKVIAEVLAKAEQCLSDLQLENGGFMSMGIENCESSAQAIIAFCALGYDESDSRVAKAVSALMEYRKADGGFSHIGSEASGISTVQSLQALTALELTKRGESLFCASDRSLEENQTTDNVLTLEAETQETEAAISGNDIRVISVIACAAFGAVLIAVWLLSGRKRTFFIVSGAVMLALAAVLFVLDIKTPEEYYSESGTAQGLTVTVLVECTEVLEYAETLPDIAIPQDGYVIAPVEIKMQEGSTAFDALVSAAKQQKISVDHTFSVMGTYVSGIGLLYEFDYGSESGWLYYVNGEKPSAASSEYKLSDGDEVRFSYTTHLSY